MLNLFYKNNGSVTIFLALIMVPVLLLTFGVVDFAKTLLAYNSLQQATDLTLNSALASYNKAVKDAYGIFAMSGDMEDLKDNMADYYLATLAANGITDSGSAEVISAIHNLLDTTIDETDLKNNNFIKLYTDGDASFGLSGVNNSQLSNPLVLKRQIVEFMKYRGPIEMAQGIFSKLDVLQDLPNQAAAVKKKIEYGKAMEKTGDAAKDLYNYLKQYITNTQRLGDITDGFNYKDTDDTQITDAVPRLETDIIKGADDSWIDYNTKLMNGYLMPLSKKLAALASVKPHLDSAGSISSRITGASFDRVITTSVLLNSILDSETIEEEDVLFYSETVDEEHFISSDYFSNSASMIAPTFSSSLRESLLAVGVNMTDLYESETVLAILYDFSKSYGEYGIYGGTLDYHVSYFMNHYRTYKEMCKLERFIYDKLKGLYIAAEGDDATLETFELIEKYEKIYIPLSKRMVIDSNSFTSPYTAEDIDEWHADISDTESIFSLFYEPLKNRMIEYTAQYAITANAYYALAKNQFGMAYDSIKGCYDDINAQLDCLKDLLPTTGSGPFEEISKKIEAAQTASDNWETSTDGINNAQMKADAKGDHSAETQFLDRIEVSDIDNMKALIVNRRNEFEAVLEHIKSFKIFDTTIYNNASLSAYTPGIPVAYMVTPEPFAPAESDVPSGPYYRQYISEIEDTDFFKFLKQIYESDEDEDAKNKATEKKNQYVNTQKSDDYLPENSSTDTLTDAPNDSNDNGKKTNDGHYNALNGDFGNITEIISVQQNIPQAPNASGDNTEVADGASDMLSSSVITDIGNLAGSIAEGLRDNIYMTEYITEFFSCQTTNYDTDGEVLADGKEEKTLTLRTMDINNNYLFGSEVEYILYGFETAENNRAAANASVFGIRFALNLIYSFTDGEINATTNALATAMGGALPFLIPIIKVVLHVVMSLTETTLDMKELLIGKAVPIYKSSSTWKCKTSNIVKQVAVTIAETAIDYAADQATDLLLEKITSLEGEINASVVEHLDGFEDLVNSQITEIQDRIKQETFDKLNQIISESVQSCRAFVTEAGAAADARQREEITRIYNRIIEQARESFTDDGSVYSMAAEKMISVFEGSKDLIINKISEKIGNYTNSITSLEVEGEVLKIVKYIEEDFIDIFNNIRNMLNLTEFKDAVKTRVTSAVSEFAEESRSFTKEKIKDMKGSLKEKISGKISNVGGSGNLSLTKSGGKTSISDLISMTYKDYLYIFLLIGTTTNENNILERTAKLIQINVNNSPVNSYKDANFKIGNAYTILNVETEAKVNTYFLGLIYENGHPKRSPSFDGKYTFSVSMNMGY